MIEVATMTTKGQITLPKEIRKALNLKAGDKVAFVTDKTGQLTIANAKLITYEMFVSKFVGTAEGLNLKNEDDVVDMIKAIRREDEDNG